MRRWFLHDWFRQGEGEQGQSECTSNPGGLSNRIARLEGGRRGLDTPHISSNQSARPVGAITLPICFLLTACDEPATRPPPQQPAPSVHQVARELDTVELARRTMPSVVAVQTSEGTGSGFFVAPDLVATCFHVVRGSSEVRFKAIGWSGKATSVVAWDEENDLAVLRVTPTAAGRGLKIDRGPYVVGSKVVVVSSPLGLNDTVSDGLVSALRSDPQDLLQFTAPISPGSSGGPILNVRGDVMGMVAGFRARVDRGVTIGQNLNFAVPASLIMVAMATPNEAALPTFAAQTVPAEEKKWREIEARLNSLEDSLSADLGERVGPQYARAIRQAVADRDGDKTKRLMDRATSLESDHKNLLDVAASLQKLGGEGRKIADALVVAWEDWALDPNDENRSRLGSLKERSVVFAREVMQRLQRPSLPEKFAGFPFMGSVAAITEYCYGYRQDAVAGIWYMECPYLPVPPPFAQGGASLTFLNGALVAVQVDVRSYEEAVKAIGGKYGEPTMAVYTKGRWLQTETASYKANTSFEWTVNGGRIRVGRLQKKPFVAFVRDERDQAVDTSF